MKTGVRKRKAVDYPMETEGSRIAAKARKLAGRLTPEERRAHVNAAMVLVYGGDTAKKTSLP